MKFSWMRGLAIATTMVFAGSNPAVAQNLFAPVILVNEDVITLYELQQREIFLEILNSPGNHREQARQGLIEDRLKGQATRAAGLTPQDEDILAGMEEFASRADLTTEEFVERIGELGVSEETYRDFVSIGITWRELVRLKFGGRVEVTEAEINRALQATGSGGATGVRVLISELIMPAPEAQLAEIEERAERISQITSIAEFSAQARQHSATATRDQGGFMDWIPLSTLPPVLRPQLLTLAIGEVTAPIPIPNAIALFQLRGIRESQVPAPKYAAIDYAEFYIPGGRSEPALARAAQLKASVDTCDDLFGKAYGQPETVLSRKSLAPGEIPTDVALELAKLDKFEVSTALTRSGGQTLVFLMLCGRTAQINEDETRQDVANSLRQKRINALSDSYIDQLMSDARIIEK